MKMNSCYVQQQVKILQIQWKKPRKILRVLVFYAAVPNYDTFSGFKNHKCIILQLCRLFH